MNRKELQAALHAAQERRARLFQQRDELSARAAGDGVDDGVAEKIGRLNAGISNLDEEIREHEAAITDYDERVANVEKWAARGSIEAGAPLATRTTAAEPTVRDEALRTLERHVSDRGLAPAAAERVENVLRRNDPTHHEARWVVAHGDDGYEGAWGKMLADGATAHFRFTGEEVAAMQRESIVNGERGMLEGTPSAGGYGLPLSLDPTIQNVSDGSICGIRQVARVITISTKSWKGVSSDGVTASYDSEASETSDDTPTLAQPSIDTAMARAFIPFSIEVGEDYPGLQAELLQLIADARDNLDAQKFLDGTGTNEPAGVLAGLTTSQRVLTVTANEFTADDVWALKAALPPRYASNATFAAAPATWDGVYRLVATADATEAVLMPTREGAVVGRPKLEWSTMATGTADSTKLIVAGDFKAGYIIADRIGMSAELLPLLVGANRRPTGERGLFVRWRTGSKVVAPNALRYLEVDAA